jgi:hypothetical protein
MYGHPELLLTPYLFIIIIRLDMKGSGLLDAQFIYSNSV